MRSKTLYHNCSIADNLNKNYNAQQPKTIGPLILLWLYGQAEIRKLLRSMPDVCRCSKEIQMVQ